MVSINHIIKLQSQISIHNATSLCEFEVTAMQPKHCNAYIPKYDYGEQCSDQRCVCVKKIMEKHFSSLPTSYIINVGGGFSSQN